MTTTMLALFVLVSGTPDDDAAAVIARYEAMNRETQLAPCSDVLPEHAASFEQAHEKWLKDHADLLRRGAAVVEAEIGSNGVDPDSSVEQARSVLKAHLLELPPAERLAWCRKYFEAM